MHNYKLIISFMTHLARLVTMQQYKCKREPLYTVAILVYDE